MNSIDDVSDPNFEAEDEVTAIEELKALKANEVIDILDNIEKVEKIKPLIEADPCIYRFFINGKVLILTSDKMLTSSMFSRRYYEEFDELPSAALGSRKIWSLFLKAIKEEQKLVNKDYEEFTSEIYEMELFVDFLRKMQATDDPKRLKKHRNLLYKHDEGLCLPSEIPKTICDTLHLKSDISRLSKLLIARSYLVTKQKSVRFGSGSSEVIKCWLFNSDVLVTGGYTSKTESGGA